MTVEDSEAQKKQTENNLKMMTLAKENVIELYASLEKTITKSFLNCLWPKNNPEVVPAALAKMIHKIHTIYWTPTTYFDKVLVYLGNFMSGFLAGVLSRLKQVRASDYIV